MQRVTYDEASIEFPPRPEDQLSGPRGRELVDIFAQNDINLSRTQLGLHVFTELDWVGIVEKPLITLNDSNLLVLR